MHNLRLLITILAISITTIEGSKDWWTESFDARKAKDIVVIRPNENKKLQFCLDE